MISTGGELDQRGAGDLQRGADQGRAGRRPRDPMQPREGEDP